MAQGLLSEGRMKKPKQQIEKQVRGLSRGEQAVITGGKPLHDGAIDDSEYSEWGVGIKDATMK